MPELPEVETIRRELQTHIIGQKIIKCRIVRPDIVAHPDPEIFCKNLINKTIQNVVRKGKYLIVLLRSGEKLIFHLRLSGTISLRPRGTALERFTRAAISLEDYELFFDEPRVLGRVHLIQRNCTEGMPKGLQSLGIEPICSDFTVAYFRKKCAKRKAYIKSLLLDQRICAGVGNIYSDEALFRAKIRPTRRANRITKQETRELIRALKNVLNTAVRMFGTSVSDYTRTNGSYGSFQDSLYVYQREGQPCRVCGATIKVKKIGNRSTRYCPKCQK